MSSSTDAERRARLRAETLARKAINDLADVIDKGHELAQHSVHDLIFAAVDEINQLRARVRCLESSKK